MVYGRFLEVVEAGRRLVLRAREDWKDMRVSRTIPAKGGRARVRAAWTFGMGRERVLLRWRA